MTGIGPDFRYAIVCDTRKAMMVMMMMMVARVSVDGSILYHEVYAYICRS